MSVQKKLLVMCVWWSDGRYTETACRSLSAAYDVIGGEAHPFERYDIVERDAK